MEGYPHGEMGWIYHSSHLHALQLAPSNHGHPQSRCCDEPAATSLINSKRRSNPVYGCPPCNFYIHKACAELVPYIRHPSHPSHTLTLVPISPYLQGSATCDACWKTVSGFSYHCTYCSFDLHTHCAFLPPTINHPSSHPHLLSLGFSSGFSSYACDLCRKKIAATAWFYHCQPCDFQAHIDCVDQARRGGPPSGAAAPWPMDGQPTVPAGQLPNPLACLTPAAWHGQVMGSPGLSSGLELNHYQAAEPAHGNSFEGLERAYNSLNDKHSEDVAQGGALGNSGHADFIQGLKNAAKVAAAISEMQVNTAASIISLV